MDNAANTFFRAVMMVSFSPRTGPLETESVSNRIESSGQRTAPTAAAEDEARRLSAGLRRRSNMGAVWFRRGAKAIHFLHEVLGLKVCSRFAKVGVPLRFCMFSLAGSITIWLSLDEFLFGVMLKGEYRSTGSLVVSSVSGSKSKTLW